MKISQFLTGILFSVLAAHEVNHQHWPGATFLGCSLVLFLADVLVEAIKDSKRKQKF